VRKRVAVMRRVCTFYSRDVQRHRNAGNDFVALSVPDTASWNQHQLTSLQQYSTMLWWPNRQSRFTVETYKQNCSL